MTASSASTQNEIAANDDKNMNVIIIDSETPNAIPDTIGFCQ